MLILFFTGCWLFEAPPMPCPDVDGDGYVEDDGECYVEDGDRVDYDIESTDCDDLDHSVYPGAIEYCDEVDNNCDGEVDNDCVIPS